MRNIDLGQANSTKELHQMLASELNFPDYYGENWDAFDEVLNDLEYFKESLIFLNYGLLLLKLPRDAKLFKKCIEEFLRQYPDNNITIDN